MKHENIKGGHNPAPRDLKRYTKPNGVFVANSDNRLAFVPKDLPPRISYDSEMILLLAEAERSVGELKGMGGEIENPHILLRAYLKHEAVLSSRIEGTLASLDDLNVYEAVGNIDRRQADNTRLWEVVNYVNALEQSLMTARETGHNISLDVIRRAHRILMKDVRGQEKNPGEFRKNPNYIIASYGRRTEIIYTPPPAERVLPLLESLVGFLQERHDNIPVLIQCAMMHYQFEAIHPFGDGNGRIGRLLLPLVLHKKGMLPEPLLYLSAFFERNSGEYYDGLLEVSRKSRWNVWIKFFLRAFSAQAKSTINGIRGMVQLQKQYGRILREANARGNDISLMEHLFANPYITVPSAGRFLDVSYQSAKGTVMNLVNLGILEQTNIVNKSRVFLAREIEEALKME